MELRDLEALNGLEIIAIASSKDTPPQHLIWISKNRARTFECCEAIAKNPAAPPEALAEIAGKARSDARALVARHPNTPVEVLASLASDESRYVRGAVAANDNCGPGVLDALVHDPVGWVRSSTPHNRGLTEAQKWQLLRDPDPGVRIGLAYGADLSGEMATILLDDPDAVVRRFAVRQPNIGRARLEEIFDAGDEWMRDGISANPLADARMLRILSESSNRVTAAEVAEHPNTPIDVVHSLAKDRDFIIREAAEKALERRLG